MLGTLVTQDFEGPEKNVGANTFTLTDQYLDSALGVMKDGKMPGKIIDQLKVPKKKVAEGTEEDIILYGSIDDPRYAAGKRDEMRPLVEEIYTDEQTYTTDIVESRLGIAS